MIGIDELISWSFLTLLFRAKINVDFRTRTTRALLSHFPEIVLFISEKNALLCDQLFPKLIGLGIFRKLIGILTTLENSHVDTIFV